MTVKINVSKELGIKAPVAVAESNKNIRKTWVLQRLMAKLSIDQDQADDTPEAFEDVLDMMLDTQDKTIAYVTDILKLDDKAQEKLEELDFNATMELAVRISSELLHIKMEEATEEDTGLEA